MFYCDPCRKERKWPESIRKDHGRCEICGHLRDCNDVANSKLPLPEANASRKAAAHAKKDRKGNVVVTVANTKKALKKKLERQVEEDEEQIPLEGEDEDEPECKPDSKVKKLQVGDVFELKRGMDVYVNLPDCYIYSNSRNRKKMSNTNVRVGQIIQSETLPKLPVIHTLAMLVGEYVVTETEFGGGGTGHGPHDIYPDGHRVTARKLYPQRHYNPSGVEVRFYQSGSFTAMIEPDKVQPIRKMARTFLRPELSVLSASLPGDNDRAALKKIAKVMSTLWNTSRNDWERRTDSYFKIDKILLEVGIRVNKSELEPKQKPKRQPKWMKGKKK